MSRPVYTASVSKLEAFRQWYIAGDDKPWVNEENFVKSLKGVYEPNDKTRFGSAYHLIVEEPKDNRASRILKNGQKQWGYYIDGMFITNEQAKPAWQYIKEHPLMVRELSGYFVIPCRQFDLLVTYRLDALEGNFIRDTKCKFSSPDMREYQESFQWRCYLHGEKLDYFFYDVFFVHGYDTRADADTARIETFEPMMCCRYEGMWEEILSLGQEFANYIDFRGYRDYISVTPISTIARELDMFPDMIWNDDTIISWGKHKGKCCKEIPDQWFKWLYESRPEVLPEKFKEYILKRIS